MTRCQGIFYISMFFLVSFMVRMLSAKTMHGFSKNEISRPIRAPNLLIVVQFGYITSYSSLAHRKMATMNWLLVLENKLL